MLDKSKRYLIVGLGLLGGKYALELSRAGFHVDGINRSEGHLQYALDHGEKLEKLIEQHKNNWNALADDLEELRRKAVAGRTEPVDGLSREATTFYEYVLQIAYDGGEEPAVDRSALKKLMLAIVELLQDTIGVLDFWKKPIEVKKLRGNIDTEILLANIPALSARHERLAVEIVKLAEKRHQELVK